MNDPRAKMDGNRLLSLGAPQSDWTKTPGRLPGFWVAALGLIVAVVYPVPALIVGAVGLMFTLQAYRVIPAGARGRGLVVAALALAGATAGVVVLQFVLALLM
ncbi:hypothetical protein E3T61_11130 [Cryobacterium lactosi]|uniref:DUF4190 domain-containing protein n=1 Tax=Cryobacterium lactosi TaxID=1259202 RepID=A0A4R9BSP4_9MICO|nr:hypothetical protein [Cryobacterium lactosi]TFD89457.1 hypothetical protein E3T61_11130 [Cryobacterium lactosi]